jgi:hypothetical protein
MCCRASAKSTSITLRPLEGGLHIDLKLNGVKEYDEEDEVSLHLCGSRSTSADDLTGCNEVVECRRSMTFS